MATRPTKPTTNEPTFSPERLEAIVAKAVAEAEERTRMAVLLEMKNAKSPQQWATGKSERSVKNEIAVVRAFKKAGFGEVVPHVDVFTFNRWVEKGFRPVEGSKSVRVNNLRLFCKAQVRPITAEEKAGAQEKRTAKTGKVIPIAGEASPQ